MARARGDKEYRLPVRGLNTETNLLDFPQDSAVDINNIDLEFNPMRLKPRLGHTSTAMTTPANFIRSLGSEVALTFFLWSNVGGDSDISHLCIQLGNSLFIIDALEASPITKIATINLNTVASGTSKGASVDVDKQPLQYTKVKGNLMISSEAITPTLLRLEVATNNIKIDPIVLNVRDTIGLESGITVDKRPTAIGDFPVGSTASGTFPDLSEEHEYNLYNQGWHQQRRLTAGSKVVSDPIAEFDTQNSEFPSNADIVFIGMVDSSGDLIFDAEFLKDQTFGSSPAARGRFVFDAFDMDRETARTSPQDSGAFTGGGGPDGGDDGGWNPTFVGPLP